MGCWLACPGRVEDSAHEPAAEEPAKFNRLMVDAVRPLSIS